MARWLATFFGLYYAEKMLDSLGITNTWNGTKHVWALSVANTSTNSNGLTFTVHDGGKMSTKGAGTTFGAGTIG